jgi:peptidoglycan/xylan/chitin deacetylase (PgdA/CDA1 family)
MPKTVFLNFHGVGTPKRRLDPGEELYWIDTAFFRNVLDVIGRIKNSLPVEISFDDGSVSDFEVAMPLLLQRQMSAAFFVLAGRLQKPGSLSPAHLRQMRAAGMRIGTHGFDHVDWRRLDQVGVEREMYQSRRVLEDAVDAPITEAAIPFGRYNRNVLAWLRTANYTRVFNSDGGAARADAWMCSRYSVTHQTRLADVETMIRGRDGLNRDLRRMVAKFVKRNFVI